MLTYKLSSTFLLAVSLVVSCAGDQDIVESIVEDKNGWVYLHLGEGGLHGFKQLFLYFCKLRGYKRDNINRLTRIRDCVRELGRKQGWGGGVEERGKRYQWYIMYACI